VSFARPSLRGRCRCFAWGHARSRTRKNTCFSHDFRRKDARISRRNGDRLSTPKNARGTVAYDSLRARTSRQPRGPTDRPTDRRNTNVLPPIHHSHHVDQAFARLLHRIYIYIYTHITPLPPPHTPATTAHTHTPRGGMPIRVIGVREPPTCVHPNYKRPEHAYRICLNIL